MVKQVNMHEAKTNFSKLAQQVEAGEEVLIARDGKVIMKLSKFEEELSVPRDFSSLKGLTSPISDEEWGSDGSSVLRFNRVWRAGCIRATYLTLKFWFGSSTSQSASERIQSI